ncbi:site-specific DNA-methyltransferase [Zunongwangia profunda]|uniref:DNA-methyltransferase n=1 Tax=Zunongwangia profunda TaxID=398743 RepID=UPI0030D7E47A
MKEKNKYINKIHNRDSSTFLSNMPDESVNLIITSPPYADKRKRYYGSVHPNKYVDWFLPIAEQLKRVLNNKGSFILNIKEHPRDGERDTYVIELILELKKQGWFWIEEYCWYKKNSFPGKWPNRFRDSWERCLHFSKQKDFDMYQDAVKVPIGDWAEKRFKSMSDEDFKRHISATNGSLGRNVSNWLDRKRVYPHNVLVLEEERYLNEDSDINGADIPNMLEFATVCYNKNHSAAFPIELPTWFIKLFSKKDDVVLDPFMGSGTTAIASILHNRNFIGVEKKKEFAQIARANIKDLIKEIKEDGKIK